MKCARRIDKRIREFPLGEGNDARSIFDLPLLMKVSVPTEQFYEEDAIAILRAELQALIDFTAALCSPSEANKTASEIIVAQFDRMLSDIDKQKNLWRNIYEEELFSRMTTTIRKTLESLGIEETAEYVDKRCAELMQ